MNIELIIKSFIVICLLSISKSGAALTIDDYLAINDRTYFVDKSTGDWISVDLGGYLSGLLSSRCGRVVPKPDITGTIEETPLPDGTSLINMKVTISNALAIAGNTRSADVYMGSTYIGQSLATICYRSWEEPNNTGQVIIKIAYITENHKVLPLHAIPVNGTGSIKVSMKGPLVGVPGIPDYTPGFARTETDQLDPDNAKYGMVFVEKVLISGGSGGR